MFFFLIQPSMVSYHNLFCKPLVVPPIVNIDAWQTRVWANGIWYGPTCSAFSSSNNSKLDPHKKNISNDFEPSDLFLKHNRFNHHHYVCNHWFPKLWYFLRIMSYHHVVQVYYVYVYLYMCMGMCICICMCIHICMCEWLCILCICMRICTNHF